MTRHKKNVDPNMFAPKHKLHELEVEQIKKIRDIVEKHLKNGIRARTKIQYKIQDLMHITVSTREISMMVQQIDDEISFNEMLNKIQSNVGKPLALKKLKQQQDEYRQKTGYNMEIVGVSPLLELDKFEIYEDDIENNDSMLDEIIEELDKIQKGTLKPTQQEKFALLTKIEALKVKGQNTKNKISKQEAKMKVLLSALQAGAMQKIQDENKIENDCSKDAIEMFTMAVGKNNTQDDKN